VSITKRELDRVATLLIQDVRAWLREDPTTTLDDLEQFAFVDLRSKFNLSLHQELVVSRGHYPQPGGSSARARASSGGRSRASSGPCGSR